MGHTMKGNTSAVGAFDGVGANLIVTCSLRNDALNVFASMSTSEEQLSGFCAQTAATQ